MTILHEEMSAHSLSLAIDAMVAEITRIINVSRNAYPHFGTESIISVEYVSDKWAKIIRQDVGRSVYAFVALQDNETKALGKVKAGDIHKPASWKAPAKHARGSVFSPDFGRCLGPYSVAYLR